MRHLRMLSREAKRTSIAVALLATVVEILALGAMFQPLSSGTIA